MTVKDTETLRASLGEAMECLVVSNPAEAAGFPRETVITEGVASVLEHGGKLIHRRSKEKAVIRPNPVGQVPLAIPETEAVAAIPPALGGRPQTVIKKDVPFTRSGGAALFPPLAKIDVVC